MYLKNEAKQNDVGQDVRTRRDTREQLLSGMHCSRFRFDRSEQAKLVQSLS
jgi:hypothetical protein